MLHKAIHLLTVRGSRNVSVSIKESGHNRGKIILLSGSFNLRKQSIKIKP